MRSLWRLSPSPAALRASASPRFRGARRNTQALASSRFQPTFKLFGALERLSRYGPVSVDFYQWRPTLLSMTVC